MDGKPRDRRWRGRPADAMAAAMAGSRHFPRAGGALLAASILLGVVGGSFARQPSLGFLAGLAVGLVLVGAVWWLDRRRGG